ncbi:MAG: KH domain-containing protein [Dehalococcoidia bacterium]|nr:KH domain-containing protein [Dehalococcoidia bacterium]
MKELVEYIAKSLVQNPEEVEVLEEPDGKKTLIHLHVAKEDMGKVIGKQGRIAQAIRTLLKVSAAKEDRYSVLLIESDEIDQRY